MNQYTQQKFVGERALFQSRDLELSYCTFADGESPLKESKNLNHVHERSEAGRGGIPLRKI